MPSKTGSKERMYGYTPAKPTQTESRGRLREYYKTNRWRRERNAFIKSHPVCEECKRQGRVRAGEVVDHIMPHPIVDFWKRENWQTLCKACNNAKGAADLKMLNEYNQKLK